MAASHRAHCGITQRKRLVALTYNSLREMWRGKAGAHYDVLGFHDVKAVSLIQHGGETLRLRPGFKATVLV